MQTRSQAGRSSLYQAHPVAFRRGLIVTGAVLFSAWLWFGMELEFTTTALFFLEGAVVLLAGVFWWCADMA